MENTKVEAIYALELVSWGFDEASVETLTLHKTKKGALDNVATYVTIFDVNGNDWCVDDSDPEMWSDYHSSPNRSLRVRQVLLFN